MSNLNNLRKIFCSIFSCAIIFNAVGCIESQDIDGPVGDDVIVSLRVDEVFQTKAYVRLNHDGPAEEYWFHMLTQNLNADAAEILRDSIEKALTPEGSRLMVSQGTNKNLTFDNLAPKTEYRVIASRVLVDGSLVGNVAELTFKTLRDLDVFEVHPEWRIEYKERRVSKDNPDEETEIFSCTVGDSKDTYVPCLLSRADYKNSYADSLRACLEDYIAFRNSEHVKWDKVVLSEDYEHVEDRLRSGDYILFMVGVDSTGVLTGYYAKEEFEIKQETASDAYLKWIGDWKLTGMCGDQSISYPVKIKAEENNLYYRMYGWESTSCYGYFEELPTALPILLYFEKSTGCAYVVSEELNSLSNLAGIYYFYLYGCIEIDYEGTMTVMPVDIPNLKVARLTVNEAGNRAYATPERFEFDMNGVHYDAEYVYFSYTYIFPAVYQGLVPVTTDSVVPRIASMVLEK